MEENEPIYPDIEVELIGEDANAGAILGRTTRAMNRGGLSKEQVDQFREEATSGDYGHLLATVQKWVTVL